MAYRWLRLGLGLLCLRRLAFRIPRSASNKVAAFFSDTLCLLALDLRLLATMTKNMACYSREQRARWKPARTCTITHGWAIRCTRVEGRRHKDEIFAIQAFDHFSRIATTKPAYLQHSTSPFRRSYCPVFLTPACISTASSQLLSPSLLLPSHITD